MANLLLERAAHQRPATTKRGALERLFTLMFQGFVYNQIWEDPDVDLEALELKPHHRLITIASGGCNVLNYLAADPAKIVAVDLNPNHIALTRLKLSALENLPVLRRVLPLLRPGQRQGQPRGLRQFPERAARRRRRDAIGKSTSRCTGRRINMFARNLYRYGLLGRFIGILHAVAKLHGKTPRRHADGAHARKSSARRSSAPSRRCSTTSRSSCCRNRRSRSTRSASRRRSTTSSFRPTTAAPSRRCASAWNGSPATFRSPGTISPGRPSDAATTSRTARRSRTICAATPTKSSAHGPDKVEIHHASLTDFLKSQPPQSLHRYRAARRAGLDEPSDRWPRCGARSTAPPTPATRA